MGGTESVCQVVSLNAILSPVGNARWMFQLFAPFVQCKPSTRGRFARLDYGPGAIRTVGQERGCPQPQQSRKLGNSRNFLRLLDSDALRLGTAALRLRGSDRYFLTHRMDPKP